MTEYYLTCNIANCRKELKNKAWVTGCSHIFCVNHGQDAVDAEKCSACNHLFTNKYDIIVMDLNPSEKYKTMILAGLSPDKIMDIADRALTFWMYQIYHEKLLRDASVRNAKQHSAELSDYCEALTTNHKMEVQKLYREIQNCQQECEEKTKAINDLVSQLAEKSRLAKNLQSQNENLKRSLANHMQIDYNRNEKQEQMCFETKQKYASLSANSRSNDFVFNPISSPKKDNSFTFEFK